MWNDWNNESSNWNDWNSTNNNSNTQNYFQGNDQNYGLTGNLGYSFQSTGYNQGQPIGNAGYNRANPNPYNGGPGAIQYPASQGIVNPSSPYTRGGPANQYMQGLTTLFDSSSAAPSQQYSTAMQSGLPATAAGVRAGHAAHAGSRAQTLQPTASSRQSPKTLLKLAPAGPIAQAAQVPPSSVTANDHYW